MAPRAQQHAESPIQQAEARSSKKASKFSSSAVYSHMCVSACVAEVGVYYEPHIRHADGVGARILSDTADVTLLPNWNCDVYWALRMTTKKDPSLLT